MKVMGQEQRGSQHAERDQETRRRILQAAEHLFLTKGFKGVSMKDIADEVQVTAAALYYHFPQGKRELFLQMVKMLLEDRNERAQRIISQAHGIEEQLTALALYMSEFSQENMFALARDVREQFQPEERGQIFKAFQRALFQQVTEIFQHAIDAGEITDEIPAHVLALMYQGATASVQFGRQHFIDDEQIPSGQDLARFSVTCFLYGIMRSSQQK
jgi:AcrR family transcriptional regulator